MSEYIVNGAEPNETVLHTRTRNGYDEWRWLPVREQVVRCRDCEHIHEFDLSAFYDGSHEHDHYSCARLLDPGCISVEPDGFCAWGERREDA